VSALSSGSGGPYRKPRLDIYTVILALALVAIIIACIVLYLEVADYGKPPYQLGLAAPVHADLAPGSTLALCCGPETPSVPRFPSCSNTPIHG
jgi:hypothetical protein